jgi:protein-glutamine gamma-glutamyltransferase
MNHFYGSHVEWRSPRFESAIRQATVSAGGQLAQSGAQFATFKKSKANSKYWNVQPNGVFILKPEVSPASAITDIYQQGGLYAFECATAMIIVLYKAVLDVIGEAAFNQLFSKLVLHSWINDPDLGLTTVKTSTFLPGDIVYFNNPQFDPDRSEWRGENAIVMGDGTYFGHGIGIRNKQEMIETLNRLRMPGATQSAHMLDQATRPSYHQLEQKAASLSSRGMDRKRKPQKSVFIVSQHYFLDSITYPAFRKVFARLEKQAVTIRVGQENFKLI